MPVYAGSTTPDPEQSAALSVRLTVLLQKMGIDPPTLDAMAEPEPTLLLDGLGGCAGPLA